MTDSSYEEQCQISDKVVECLGLEPLLYSYPETDEPDPDGCRPAPGEVFDAPIMICVSEFFEGLTVNSDIKKALAKVAIEGECTFSWPVGYWTQKSKNSFTITDPMWADVFIIANKAYIDGGCPDHRFLEGFDFSSKSKCYEFCFGS